MSLRSRDAEPKRPVENELVEASRDSGVTRSTQTVKFVCYYLTSTSVLVKESGSVIISFLHVFFSCFQGLDEEAIVDHGKSSFTTNTNYEKEDLESEFKTGVLLFP